MGGSFLVKGDDIMTKIIKMADFTSINIMKAVIVITDPKVDQMIVDYDDNTQKILFSDSDVSGESQKLQNIFNAFFTS